MNTFARGFGLGLKWAKKVNLPSSAAKLLVDLHTGRGRVLGLPEALGAGSKGWSRVGVRAQGTDTAGTVALTGAVRWISKWLAFCNGELEGL